ncbi:hypothetical protein P280DRAFT_517004 [Massarina eburnea CBS 473.64]|uniref:Uncharacterized protein n=1 Tax=Massarina eburnea CBS 473.64 TaxID=1395130 RepID=A0A6A6S6E5_9PLEO|nr:hypothetical protein P280DRAFT_517004 [Massarina eburnea CBS 473.64]
MSTTPRTTSTCSVTSSTLASPSDAVSSRQSSFTLKAALKKPFQGWRMEALWAREGLDDDYNFPAVKRRGDGMPGLNMGDWDEVRKKWTS